MLTLKAALLDLDAGDIVRPGILRIEGDRIAGAGGQPEGDVVWDRSADPRRDGLLGIALELTREAGALLRAQRSAPRLVHL